MSSKLKQLLTVLLSVCIVFAFSSVSAFAEGEGTSVELEITNIFNMFKPTVAKLVTSGEDETLELAYSSTSYDKAYMGTSKEAVITADPTKTVEKKDGVYKLPIEKDAETFYVAFHSVKNEGWYNRIFTIDRNKKTLVTDNPGDPIVLDSYASEWKALADAKANAKAELNKVKTSNYAGAELTKVNNAIKSGKDNIDKATSIAEVNKALKNAKDAIGKAKTKAQVIAAEKKAVQDAKITKVTVKAGKKKVTVTWKKNSKFAGYQIKVINKKTKKTVKTVKVGAKVQKKVVSGLKSKTTFKVQLVGYKKIDGTVVCGKTVTKTVKVR